MRTTKRSSEGATLVAQACTNVQGFSDMYRRLKRRMSTSGRSTSTLNNYARHLAQMALHLNCLPTELEDDQPTKLFFRFCFPFSQILTKNVCISVVKFNYCY